MIATEAPYPEMSLSSPDVSTIRTYELWKSTRQPRYRFTVPAAMHPALAQFDIIHEIFTHLSTAPLRGHSTTIASTLRPQEYWCEESLRSTVARCQWVTISSIHALRSLSLTCKAFSEPALDELWAAPPGGLYTLLRLLSNFKLLFPENFLENDMCYVSFILLLRGSWWLTLRSLFLAYRRADS